MNRYNELIDKLIYIKGTHDDLSMTEIDVINRACNVLEQEGERGSRE